MPLLGRLVSLRLRTGCSRCRRKYNLAEKKYKPESDKIVPENYVHKRARVYANPPLWVGVTVC